MAYFKNAAMNQLIDLVRTAISQISGSGTDHAKVTAAALVNLNSRLEALENASSEDFGNIVAETIDLVDFPKVAGAPTVVIGSGAPASAPDFAGQFFFVPDIVVRHKIPFHLYALLQQQIDNCFPFFCVCCCLLLQCT